MSDTSTSNKRTPALYDGSVPATFYSLVVEQRGNMKNPKVEMTFKVSDGGKVVVKYPAGHWTLKPNGVATKVADWIPPSPEPGNIAGVADVSGRFFPKARFMTANTVDGIEKDLRSAGWTGDDMLAVATFYSDESNHGKPFQGLGNPCKVVLETELTEYKDGETVARLDQHGHIWPRNVVLWVNGEKSKPSSTVKEIAKGGKLADIFSKVKKGGSASGGHEGSETGETAPPAVGDESIPF